MRKIFNVELGTWIACLIAILLFGRWALRPIEVNEDFIVWVWLGLSGSAWYLSYWGTRYTAKQKIPPASDDVGSSNIDSRQKQPQTPIINLWSSWGLAFCLTGGLARDTWSLDLPHGILIMQMGILLNTQSIHQDLSAFNQKFDWARLLTLVSVFISLLFGVVPLPGLEQSDPMAVLFGLPITLMFVTAFLDFYNFMGSVDGLVTGTAIIQTIFLAIYLDQPALIFLPVALIGFLPWNWPPAKVVIGKTGNNALGLLVAVILLNGDPVDLFDTSPELFWSAIAVTFPLMGDATYTAIRRLLRGEDFFRIRKSRILHLYQRLQQAGWSDQKIALTYAGMTGVIALLVYQFNLVGSAIAALLTLLSIITAELYLKQSGTVKPRA
ncbi:MAG: hypothetical protein F6J87_09660 [Spirulina sp. SIO3F2]|nr:hypothetical protein [Spirulina sp. SIO3F2]